MSADDQGRGGCPDAYTLLAFGVGATLGVLVPFGRLIIHAIHYLKNHYPHKG